jgi:ABC-2 type transport system permease protein
MNLSKSYTIAVNDLSEVFSSKAIYMPMIGIPVFFAVMLPILTFYVSVYNLNGIVSHVFGAASIAGQGLSGNGGLLFMSYFATYVLGPIFLTMPIFTAAVIAADSFAGEKERKTAEALLSTPITTAELLIGKIAASFIPALAITFVVFAIYGGIVNYLALQSFGSYILPSTPWILTILLAPFLSIAAIGIVVLVSAHVKGIKEAQQISSLLVLPILIMPFASILDFININTGFFIQVMIVLSIVDLAIIYFGVKSFRKESLLE